MVIVVFFPHSNSVSVQHVFIKIERIIKNKNHKKGRGKKKYTEKSKLLLAQISFQTINMSIKSSENAHTDTHIFSVQSV